MEDRIVPFGKHKGKPIEVLSSDKPYLDWLLTQSWFKEKFLNIYNIVINYSGEPIDTPEHNKMQIKFLDLNYRLKLVYFLYPEIFEKNCHYINNSMINWLNSKEIESNERNNFVNSLLNPDKAEQLGLYTTALLWYSNPIFENVDVSFEISYGLQFYYEHRGVRRQYINKKTCEVKIEIKPTISDDFPSILRRMKASMPIGFYENNHIVTKYHILFVGQYTGIGASKTEFREYFNTQGYLVVFEDELSDIEIPSYDKQFIIGEKLKELLKLT